MIERFIEYLKSHIGDIYVWGAQGEIASEAFIKKHETSTININRALTLYNKRVKEGRNPIYAFDCSGLVVNFLLDNKLISADTTAQGLYNKCTKLNDRAQLKQGDFVFRDNGTKVHHIGVYIGNNKVIESYGRDVGVVNRDINASGKNYWNRYGRYEKLFEMENETMKTVLKVTSPLMQGEAIKTLQTALNALGYDCGVADGKCGKNTMSGIEAFCKAHIQQTMPTEITTAVTVDNKTYKGTLKGVD